MTTPAEELLARLDWCAKDSPGSLVADAATLIREQAAQLEAERKVRERVIETLRKEGIAGDNDDLQTAVKWAVTLLTKAHEFEAEIKHKSGYDDYWNKQKQHGHGWTLGGYLIHQRQQATLAESRLATLFERTREKICSPLFQQFIKQGFWHAHHVDLVWRMDGKDITEQADWLKDLWYYVRALQPEGEESAAQTDEQVCSAVNTAVLYDSHDPVSIPASAAALIPGLERAAEICVADPYVQGEILAATIRTEIERLKS